MVAGWTVVAAFAAALVAVSWVEVAAPDVERAEGGDFDASEQFARAWERSRTGTFVAVGVYRRTSEVTGATIRSDDVVAQRPPRRLHRQLGGVEGRDDDRSIVCPAPPEGSEEREPCRLGPSAGETYLQSVEREVAGVRSLTTGPAPLYDVREDDDGCFSLVLERADPRAPFGVRARFCFDRATGAVRESTVRHEGGIVEVVSVTSIRATVTAADLDP